jgi:hypothetical protein
MNDTFVKVPFKREKDGSRTFFLPDCKGPNGQYRVGPKGSVVKFDDYWQALERVMSFSPPEFRRINANGNQGRVVCEPGDVEEVSRAHIEQLAARHGQ